MHASSLLLVVAVAVARGREQKLIIVPLWNIFTAAVAGLAPVAAAVVAAVAVVARTRLIVASLPIITLHWRAMLMLLLLLLQLCSRCL